MVLKRAQRIDSDALDRPVKVPIRRMWLDRNALAQRYIAVASPSRLETGTSGLTVMCAIHYALKAFPLKTSLKRISNDNP